MPFPHFKILLFIYLCSLAIGCINDTSPSKAIDIEFVRFDNLLFSIQNGEDLDSLVRLYPDFCKIYFNEVLPVAEKDDYNLDINQIKSYQQDSFLLYLKDECQKKFDNFKTIENEFGVALSRYVDLFELEAPPKLYTYISGLSYQRFIFDDKGKDGIGIGLDMFLGPEFPYKLMAPQNPSFSEYISRSFTREYLLKKTVELLIEDKLGQAAGNKLLDYMIHNGKKLYLTDRVLGNAPDSIVMEYTTDQMEWCEKYELKIWSTFLGEKLLYENDLRKINKYIYPSPNSPKMPKEAPGRTANFIGKQIVENFMKRNPKTSISALINFRDAQGFLEQSKYRPG